MNQFTNQPEFIAHYNQHAADPITEANLSAVLERAVWDGPESSIVHSTTHRLIKIEGSVEFKDKSGNPFVVHLERWQEWLVDDGELTDMLNEGFKYDS